MKVAMISCFMRTAYAAYTDSLCTAMKPMVGSDVDIIASNCGCGDDHAKKRMLYGPGCTYFELPHLSYDPKQTNGSLMSASRLKLGEYAGQSRARTYSRLSAGADVVHFQQILGAYGSRALFHWAKTSPEVKKVVTVHELDSYQLTYRDSRSIYRSIDRIIVLFEDMKAKLVGLGVDENKLRVVNCGADLLPESDETRDGIIFYGGHHFNLDKGIEVVLQALKRVIARPSHSDLRLKIHGHYSPASARPMRELVSSYGLDDHVVWLDNIYEDEMTRQYQASLFMVVPFKGSSAGMVATRAMACGLPIIGTREAGLPDYLGDAGIYIDVGDDAALEREMLRLLDEHKVRQEISQRVRARAAAQFTWDKIAAETVSLYEDVLSR